MKSDLKKGDWVVWHALGYPDELVCVMGASPDRLRIRVESSVSGPHAVRLTALRLATAQDLLLWEGE